MNVLNGAVVEIVKRTSSRTGEDYVMLQVTYKNFQKSVFLTDNEQLLLLLLKDN